MRGFVSALLASTAVLVPSASARAQQTLTLDAVLQVARTANAALPVARLDVSAAAARLRAARARLWPQALVHSNLQAAVPPEYGVNASTAQLVGTDALYDGGRLRADIRVASADEHAAEAGLQMQEKDLVLQVERDYYAAVEADGEIQFERELLKRLDDYLTSVRLRQAGGQGIASDVLRTEVLVGTERSNLFAAERRHEDMLLELNYLMGRPPSTPIALAPLPEPVPPSPGSDTPWTQVPELRAALADEAAATAQVAVARAGRRPHVDVTVTAGRLDALFGVNDLNNVNAVASAAGASAMVSLNWPIWDVGLYRAQLAQAQIAAEQAAQRVEATRQRARFQWQLAVADLDHLYQQVQVLAQAVPHARDAALTVESLYRGGVATSLEVVDAYRTWLDANRGYVTAVQQYRNAEAHLVRWGTP